MNNKPICILLVDDNPDDNFFHEREIKRNNPSNAVVTRNSAIRALEYLKSEKDLGRRPDLIFLDINMPGMNGWEFLEAYGRMDKGSLPQSIIEPRTDPFRRLGCST